MSGAIAFSANPVTQIIEDKLREQLKAVKRTSMGSEYVAFHASRDEVIALAESDLVNAFRRVILDPVRGLVMLMTPSGRHEITSRDMDRFVGCVAALKGIKTKQLGSTRWRRESDPKNTGNEADCSFYFGQKAIDCGQAYARSETEGDAYTYRVAPDLVVEVELTHKSKEKYLSYRDKGVVEFWQLNARGKTVTATFLDLQTQPDPLEVDTSINLSDLKPAHVIEFIQRWSKEALSYLEYYEVVRYLLEDNKGALRIREEAAEYEFAS